MCIVDMSMSPTDFLISSLGIYCRDVLITVNHLSIAETIR